MASGSLTPYRSTSPGGPVARYRRCLMGFFVADLISVHGAHGLVHRSVRESGFTIIESVVAAAGLATGLVALAQTIAVATLAASRARGTTRATLAAAQKIEELRANASATPPLDASDVVDNRFLRRWTISAPSSDSPFTIAVEVTPLARTSQ